MDIKPIETRYRGFRFRSRLEARYAVLFDALDVPWEYEGEGFNLQGMFYLPDFWLPLQKCFVEVKPSTAQEVCYRWDESGNRYVTAPSQPCTDEQLIARTLEDFTKAHRLAVSTGHRVFMCFSDLESITLRGDRVFGSNKGWYAAGTHDDGCCAWGECPICHALDIAVHGQHSACKCLCDGQFVNRYPGAVTGDYPICERCGISNWGKISGPHRPWLRNSGVIQSAFLRAKSARFEHGETPKV